MRTQNKFFSKNNSKIANGLGHRLRTNKLAKITEIISVFILAFLFIDIFISKEDDKLLYNQAIIWIANILMLTIIWIGLKLRGEGLSAFGFGFKRFTWQYGVKTFMQSILVFILALSGFIIGSIIMANISEIPESSDMSNYAYLKDNIWMLFLTLGGMYIVSSIGEEVIYRAFLINRITELGLNNKLGQIITVVFSAVIFGLAHYSWGPMGIVQTSFMGLVLGGCYLYFKKRIWILIIAHAYMDTILMVQLYLN